MFFRNLTLFRFPTSLDLSDLDTHLADMRRLKPVGALELSSRGFISPFGRDGEALSHRIGDALWLTVGGEDKLLPGVGGQRPAAEQARGDRAEGRPQARRPRRASG